MSMKMMNNLLNQIILGDAIKVLDLIPADSIHLIITSPPYNLNKEYTDHDDEMPYNEYLNWMKEIWVKCNRVLINGGRLCINIGENKRKNITYPTFSAFIQQCIDINMLYRGTIIWNKNSAAKHCAWGSWNSCSNPHIVPRHEYIVIFSKNTFKLDGDKVNCDLNKDGKEFSVRPKGTREQRKEYFKNGFRYVGKKLTVIFQEYEDSGIPRFPVGKDVREGY